MIKREDRKPMSPAEFDAKVRSLWRKCDFLSETSGRRSPIRNAAVGGKPGSKHVLGMAQDFGAPTRKLLDHAMKVAVEEFGFWVEVHDVGSGMHLHVQGLPPGDVPQEWVDLHGEEVKING